MLNKSQRRLLKHKNGAGFTLIEIILVMALFAVVFGVGSIIGFDSYHRNSLKTERDILIGILQKARSQAINNINNKQHGFYFDGTDYIVFEGDSYVSRDSSRDLKTQKNPSITISGLTEVVFEQLTGNVNSIGDIILSDNNSTSSVSLSFNQEGRINW